MLNNVICNSLGKQKTAIYQKWMVYTMQYEKGT